MSKTTSEENLEARAQLFKALGHPARLLILNLIKMKPRHGEELAEILRLKPATISHHLGKLTEAGLLTAKKDQYYQTYSLVRRVLDRSLQEVVHIPQMDLSVGVEEDAYRKKVLRSFFKHGQLVQIPAQYKKQLIILEKLADEFEPDQRYTEKQVNQMLLEFHEDVASLRRMLIDHKLMAREKGIYWRLEGEKETEG
ncbi:MAG: metalloregulator ArsR/SmtB family transcription factor [Anaerolineales bacterium]|jgi:DNA-binding HxlR family transcriptional regulator